MSTENLCECGLAKNYVDSHKLCFMLAYDGFQERPIGKRNLSNRGVRENARPSAKIKGFDENTRYMWKAPTSPLTQPGHQTNEATATCY